MPKDLLQVPNRQENVEACDVQHAPDDQVASEPNGDEWAWDAQ